MDKPQHIPLNNFSYAKADKLHNLLNTHLCDANLRMDKGELDSTRATGSVRGGHAIKNILHQLWILVVKPILDSLEFSVSTLGISTMLK